jgi:steroid delta-isomerase
VPTPQQIREIMERYVKRMSAGDADGIAALYRDDATLEDPVGAPLVRGKPAILDWYRKSAGRVKLELTGPVRVCGLEAATPLLARAPAGPGKTTLIDIIDVMRFDEEGRIASMRAFWSADAIRVVEEG